MLRKTLHCRACGWRTIAGPDELVARLRLVGQLRREKEPDDQIIDALLAEAAPRMTCSGCRNIGLRVAEADEEMDQAPGDPGDWQAAVLCEACRQPIDPERLEVLPTTRRCTACQHQADTGTAADEQVEFCPKCGAVVELRVSRGTGITRYKRFCTAGCRL